MKQWIWHKCILLDSHRAVESLRKNTCVFSGYRHMGKQSCRGAMFKRKRKRTWHVEFQQSTLTASLPATFCSGELFQPLQWISPYIHVFSPALCSIFVSFLLWLVYICRKFNGYFSETKTPILSLIKHESVKIIAYLLTNFYELWITYTILKYLENNSTNISKLVLGCI